MTEMYQSPQGFDEQVKFYRQQPRHLSCQPFDFEEGIESGKNTRLEKLIFWISVAAAVAAYVLFYWPVPAFK